MKLRALTLILLVFIFSCSEQVKKESIEDNESIDEKTNTPRYEKERESSSLKIVIPSEFSRITLIEKDIEKAVGFDVDFVKRHFFTDIEVFQPEEFDGAISNINSSLSDKLIGFRKIGEIARDEVVLASGHSFSKALDKNTVPNWEAIYQASVKSGLMVSISNPGWNAPSYQVWTSWVRNSVQNRMQEITDFPNGNLGFAIDKLIKGEIHALWMMRSTANSILSTYKKDNKVMPFNIYPIDSKTVHVNYSFFEINESKNNQLEDLFDFLKSENGQKLINKHMFMDKIDNMQDEQIKLVSHKDALKSIDDFLEEKYPLVKTYLIIPKTDISESHMVLQKLINTYKDLSKHELDTLETVSRIRKGEQIAIYSYFDEHHLIYDSEGNDGTYESGAINAINKLALSELEKKSQNPEPYKAFLPVIIEAAIFKKKNPDYEIKIMIIVSDGYENDSPYAEFAEEYIRVRPNYPELFSAPIDVVVLGEANRDNMNGIAGLSRGLVVDADKNQFKRSVLILRNNF